MEKQDKKDKKDDGLFQGRVDGLTDSLDVLIEHLPQSEENEKVIQCIREAIAEWEQNLPEDRQSNR